MKRDGCRGRWRGNRVGRGLCALEGLKLTISPPVIFLSLKVGRGLCALEGLKQSRLKLRQLVSTVGRGLCALEGLKHFELHPFEGNVNMSAAACVP